MEITTSGLAPFYNEYVLTINQGIKQSIIPQQGLKFLENEENGIRMKWFHLPISSGESQLHKLVIYNDKSDICHAKLMIQYHMKSSVSVPFVYYSPHNESIMVCDDQEYYLVSGIGPNGGSSQYQTNEIDMEAYLEDKSRSTIYAPISQHSYGWGMVYDITIEPHKNVSLYDWTVKREKLYDLESAHEEFKQLLGDKVK
ncbi:MULTISPECIES: hypothetical protein [Salipaludibacillus]|nr:hypothetical protein [Salipaludibacillus neizhouensis]